MINVLLVHDQFMYQTMDSERKDDDAFDSQGEEKVSDGE